MNLTLGIIWYSLIMCIPSTNLLSVDSHSKNLKRTYDKKKWCRYFCEVAANDRAGQGRDEKSTRKPLREPHYEIYDCRPLRVQLYLRKIRFIKLRRWSSLSTIEGACEEILFYTDYSINIKEDNHLEVNFVIKISSHIAVFKRNIVI